MKLHLACIVAIGLLAACSQAETLRDTEATGYYVSDTSVEDAATCVSGAWSNKSTQMAVVPTAGGTSIQLRNPTDGSMVVLVDIIATGPTTTAKYYSKRPGENAAYANQVMDCMHATSSIQ